MGRTYKHHGMNPNRGFKQIQGIAARGFKHVGNALRSLPKTIANSDTLARKTANTLQNLGEYASLASAATGHEGLAAAGKSLSGLGSSIHNFRRGDFANRLRKDFQHKSIMDA
jgi:hypothetical protein